MLVKAMCYFNMDVESYRPGQHPITIFLLMQVKHIESRFALVISDYEEKWFMNIVVMVGGPKTMSKKDPCHNFNALVTWHGVKQNKIGM